MSTSGSRLRGAIIAAALVALATGCSSGSATNNRPGEDPTPEAGAMAPNGTVVRVVDGDTLIISTGGEDERVRLIGIDTPETVHPNRPVMCFGKKASAHMAELLGQGTEVHLERDVEARDRYGRLLAYVYRASDGVFVNLEMIRGGFAKQATYPPNVAHVDEFRDAASLARTTGTGLWSACDRPFEE